MKNPFGFLRKAVQGAGEAAEDAGIAAAKHFMEMGLVAAHRTAAESAVYALAVLDDEDFEPWLEKLVAHATAQRAAKGTTK
jgi:CO dehydrogenase/acetyl-CoA synthase epsilon subunit